MCKICSKDFSILNETIEYSGIEFAMMVMPNGSLIRVRHFPEGYEGLFDNQDIILIKYCPFCGKRLP